MSTGPSQFAEFDLWSGADHIEQLQSELVARTIRRVSVLHPYYRQLMAEGGLSPDGFDDLRSLDRFPLTDKTAFMNQPEAFRLDEDPAAPLEYVLWDIAYTAGTSSGRPTPMYQTAHDFRALMVAQRRMAEIRGMHESDRIMNLYPMTPLPHGAWLRANQAAAAIGASITNGMSGREVGGFHILAGTDAVVRRTIRADPTVLWGVPSYVRRVLESVVAGGGRLASLRMIAVSGEPCGAGMRRSLVDLSIAAGADRAVHVSDSLGATELQCGLVECVEGTGFHNPAPELFHISCVGDDGESVSDGIEGRLILTHLDRRGTVLIRFLLGDRAIVTREPCSQCGRAGGRVTTHLGRTGRLAKVRGNLVDLGAVSDALGRLPDVVEHQLVIRRPEGDPLGLDELVVRIVVDTAVVDPDVEARVGDTVALVARMQARVEVVTLDVIWDRGPDMKPPRVLDLRADERD